MQRIFLAYVSAFWLAFGASGAWAQPEEVPIIEPGREQEVLALFAPYRLLGEVAEGYSLENVRIEATHIVCELEGPEGESASVRLDHPEHAAAPDGASASFAVTREASSPAGRRAADVIYAAIRANDGGGFYRRLARPQPPSVVSTDHGRGMSGWRAMSGWAFDGSLLIGLGLLLFVVLLGRELARGSRAAIYVVLGASAVGALLRLAMSPETMLGAWPFSRTSKLMHLVWSGPGLGSLLERIGGEVRFFDAVIALGYLFAVVTPGAVFLHAKKLLDDERAACLASVLVAFLPIHLRFSQSEVAFIPSIALSAFTFALVHVALKDGNAGFRLAALLALPLVAGLMFVTRPLNQIFLPLLLFTALYLSRRDAPLSRRLLVSAVLAAVCAFTFVSETLVLYSGQIAEGASFTTVWHGVLSFFMPAHNTLIVPSITPPLLLLLAIIGAYWTLRDAKPMRERGVFLLAWLALFYVAHGYVLPMSIQMQARYHLHLVVPFVMLAGLAWSRLYDRRRALFWLAAAYVALMPLMHRGFIEDVSANDQREYAFVRMAAEQVPAGCTVLEFTGPGEGGVDVRFDRVGALLDGTTERRLFTAIPIGADLDADDPLREEARALLAEPQPCLYYYEGLFCFARKEISEPIAPACAEMHRAAELEEVTSRSFESRLYDGNLAEGMGERGGTIGLGLFRVVGPRR